MTAYGQKKYRPKLMAAGIMLVSGAMLFAGSAVAADYLGAADDFAQLQQLMARYNSAIDLWDPPAYAAVFTADGIFHLTTRDAANGEIHRSRACYVGKDQLIGLVAKGRPNHVGEQPEQHMTTLGPVHFIDKDHAYAHSTLLVVGSAGFIRPFQPGTGLSYTGSYDDTFQRVNGRWLIADRNENLETAQYEKPLPCPSANK